MKSFVANNFLVTLGNDKNNPCIKCHYDFICQNSTIGVPDKILQILDICLMNDVKYIPKAHFYVKNIIPINRYKLLL